MNTIDTHTERDEARPKGRLWLVGSLARLALWALVARDRDRIHIVKASTIGALTVLDRSDLVYSD